MAKKTRKKKQPRRRRRTTLRHLALAASLALAVGLIAWLVLRAGGDSGPEQYLVEPAQPFTLPTIAGEEVSLADYLDRQALLLYFNEGMG